MLPGLRPLHSIGIPRRTIAADAVLTYDLAVNPLTAILLNIRPLNETSTLSNYANVFAIAQSLNSVQVLYRGEMIKSMRGEDLLAYNWYRWGIVPWEANPNDTDNERRSVTIPLIFGKHPYDPDSCFPATHRGELILQLDYDVADTGYDNYDISVDFIELLGATPKEYEKNVSQGLTYPATGDQDVDLPIGNVFRNVLCWGNTTFTGASPAATLGRMKVLLGNQEQHYTAIDFETANVMSMLWGRQPTVFEHRHRVDATGGATQQTTAPVTNLGNDFRNYAWIDFDPTKDDTYSLDTAGSNRFHIRNTVGTADAARFIPTEVIAVTNGSAS